MPNGHDQRWEDEKEYIIEPLESEGWESVEGPDWVVESVPDSIQKIHRKGIQIRPLPRRYVCLQSRERGSRKYGSYLS